jgi:LexA-binding, inner membrane-associated putative hydrolase
VPFTPFHMGPGIALKALAPRHFSLTAFGVTQVVIDVEPLVRILRGDAVLHGFTHTYLGATLIGAACAVLGKPLCQALLNLWKPDPEAPFLTWLRGEAVLSWHAVLLGAFVGTWSHVALDSVMHADVHPFRPWSDANGLLGALSLPALHRGCLLAGAAGALVLFAHYRRTVGSARAVR